VVVAALAASVVAVIAFTGGSLSELQYLRDRAGHMLVGESLYRTAVGERLAVPLEDGSLLTLNTDTRAVVRYRDGIRGVTLQRGQALFEVAKDASRPFVVTAGGRTVTALGTAFDVRLSDSRFEVTMLEGRVVVAQQPEHAPLKYANADLIGIPTELGAGDQLLSTATVKRPVVRKADARRVTSWREGQIIFDNDALDYAVDELNRYGRQKLVLSDPRLANLRVSGAFYTRNTGVFIDMLTVHFPVHVKESGDDRVVLSYDG
jgi:transmembrane sensor